MTILATIFAPNTPTIVGDLGVDHTETIKSLENIGKTIPGKPEFIVIVSPHFRTHGGFGVVTSEKIRQIFDFYGFPEELYRVKYEPKGSPVNARRLLEILHEDGISAREANEWGLDHGAWSPLLHIFPGYDIPVIPVSISDDLPAEDHEKLGRSIRKLADTKDLVLITTGSIIHRLDLWQNGGNLPEEALEYLDICLSAFKSGSFESIWDAPLDLYRAAQPEGGEAPLRILNGSLGKEFTSSILSNEIEFNAASLTTVTFHSLKR